MVPLYLVLFGARQHLPQILPIDNIRIIQLTFVIT